MLKHRRISRIDRLLLKLILIGLPWLDASAAGSDTLIPSYRLGSLRPRARAE